MNPQKIGLTLGALSLLFLAGCGSAFRMSYLRNSFQVVGDSVGQSQNIAASRQAIYHEIISQTSTPEDSPYPEMRECLGRMDADIASQKQALAQVPPVKAEFEKFAATREEITDKDPDWPRFQVLQSRCNTALNGVNRYTGLCAGEAATFDKLIIDNGIEKIEVEPARRDLNKFFDETSARIDNFAIDVASAEAGLMRGVARGYDSVAAFKSQSALARLEKTGGDLKDRRREVAGEIAGFTAATFHGKRTAWLGPGMGEIPGRDDLRELRHDLEDAEHGLKAEVDAFTPKPEPRGDDHHQDNHQGPNQGQGR